MTILTLFARYPRVAIDSLSALRPRFGAFAAMLALAALGACGKAGGQFGTGNGDTAYVGIAGSGGIVQGAQVALDRLNANRPPSAPVLAIRLPSDTTLSPVQVAVLLRDDPSVVAVAGHTESAAAIAAGPVYADREHDGRNAVAVVTPAAARAVTRISPWIFRVNPTIGQQGRALARHLSDSLGLRTAGVLYRNDAMGSDFVREFTDEFTKKGGVVLERDPFSEQIDDFEAYAKRLVMRKSESVVIAGNPPQIAKMMDALREAGGSPAILATNGPAAGDRGDFRGLHHVVLFDAGRHTSPEAVQFVAAYQAQFNRPPSHWAALGFDAATLIGRAVHAKGRDRRSVRDWLATVGKETPAHAGATGPIGFDENGDPVNMPILLGRVAP